VTFFLTRKGAGLRSVGDGNGNGNGDGEVADGGS